MTAARPSRPILLNSCARAATAAEARFRIDAPPQQPRSTGVVALDPGALALVTGLAGQPWRDARFLGCDPGSPAAPPGGGTDNGAPAGVRLRTVDGAPVRLAETLGAVDFLMMIATGDRGAAAAAAIGSACTLRGITTAGVVVGADGTARAAVGALRPHVRVLLVTSDADDAGELLAAMGA